MEIFLEKYLDVVYGEEGGDARIDILLPLFGTRQLYEFVEPSVGAVAS